MAAETVLVTGASAGLGVELARLFAADGARIVLTARRADRLTELAAELGNGAEAIPADLAVPGAAAALVAALHERDLAPDVVVNNAGFGANGLFHELDADRQAQMVQLNVNALTELARALLPAMVERRRGGVLNVASTAAFQPGPRMAVYYATKSYVLAFSEALSEELRGTGVHATCFCPGPTRTEFAEVAGMTKSRLFRLFARPAGPVARAGYRGFRRRKAIVVPGLTNKLGTWSVRFTPRWLVRKIVRRLQ